MKYNTEKILRTFKESLEEHKRIQRKFELEYLKNKNSHLVLLRRAGYLNEEIDEIIKKSEQETLNNAFNKNRYDNETTKKEAVEEYKKIVEKNIRKKVRK